MQDSYQIKVSISKPSDIQGWDALANANGNFFQSTLFDKVQDYFSLIPHYIEVYVDNRLVGGVKLYYLHNTKLGILSSILSRKFYQHGEWLIDTKGDETENRTISLKLSEAIKKHARDTRATILQAIGFYGPKEQLVNFEGVSMARDFQFNVASVRIDKSDEELIKSFNRNTRRNINKAIDENLSLERDNDELSHFFRVMTAIYDEQQSGARKPDFKFIADTYQKIKNDGVVDVFITSRDGNPLAATFFVRLGDTAYSWYGGAVRNDIGAGHFAYYELMKMYRDKGIKNFVFGQVSSPSQEDLAEKFVKGISGFKRGFSPEEKESYNRIFLLKPFYCKTWNLLLKLYRN